MKNFSVFLLFCLVYLNRSKGNSCVENVDCLSSKKGLSYVGYENKTISGRTCKSWQGHFIGGDLEGNFCRNPDEDKTVWCYTTDPEKQWEYCDIKECKDCNDGPPSNCRCGIVNQRARIVGGAEAEVNEYPWMALLILIGYQFCGGSLISSRWIISAAHCTWGHYEIKGHGTVDLSDPQNFLVSLGDHDITTNNEANHIVRHVSQIFNQPGYNNFTKINDISLLKMTQEVDFSVHQHIRPICLPLNDENSYQDMMAIATGWGHIKHEGVGSPVLLEVYLKVLSNNICMEDYHWSDGSITDQMLCAYSTGKDTCQSDSGGPLITRGSEVENYELIGVTSFGEGCAFLNWPGVYARVTKQLNWISEVTNGLQGTCPR